MEKEITVTVVLNQTTAINMRGEEKELVSKIKQLGKGLYITNIDSTEDGFDSCEKVMIIATDNLLNTAVLNLRGVMDDEYSNLI
jgi:hypothetical protein